MARETHVSDRDYARLLELRTRLRRFEQWSADQAAAHDVTASQHQLLLAIRGHTGEAAPTVRDIADYLVVRHNTAVGLIDRTEALGLLERRRDVDDHRIVRLSLTDAGAALIAQLSGAHLAELAQLGAMLADFGTAGVGGDAGT